MTDISIPQIRKFSTAYELAEAYDRANVLVTEYERKYDDGNFHVVLGDGNIERGYVAGDYRDMKRAELDHTIRHMYDPFPDPEGIAWMEAALILPEISMMDVFYDGSIIAPSGEYTVNNELWIVDILCPRCGTYQELEDAVEVYSKKMECSHPACAGRGPRYVEADIEAPKHNLYGN